MGGTALHAGILAEWCEMLLLSLRYYGRQWDFILCNDTLYHTTEFSSSVKVDLGCWGLHYQLMSAARIHADPHIIVGVICRGYLRSDYVGRDSLTPR